MKRTFDIFMSLNVLLLLMPVIIIIAITIVCKLGSPIIFKQKRPGHQGKPFTIIKFRTMREAIVEGDNLLPDSDRLTRFGLFLRKTSLDELPELWNVIKGDMSLVGPRPLLLEYLSLYSREQARRHEIKPGITGWAQINGRNAISWDEKFRLDVWYVDNHSFVLDLKILMLTVKKVFMHEGISADGHVSMGKFKGNN